MEKSMLPLLGTSTQLQVLSLVQLFALSPIGVDIELVGFTCVCLVCVGFKCCSTCWRWLRACAGGVGASNSGEGGGWGSGTWLLLLLLLAHAADTRVLSVAQLDALPLPRQAGRQTTGNSLYETFILLFSSLIPNAWRMFLPIFISVLCVWLMPDCCRSCS